METVFITLIAGIVAAPLILGVGSALVVITVGLAALAAVVSVVLEIFAPLLHLIRRWLDNHFSPVRRRHPRPAGWHQWR